MSAENNLILITNDNTITDILKPRLVLLREVDDILSTTYLQAIDDINSIFPETILIYCSKEKEDCLKLIRAIRNNDKSKDTSILLIVDKFNQDFVLNAYEENISDFITIDADDAEILIRTIWCLKKSSGTRTLKKQHYLLEALDVIDKKTGFYTEKFSSNIFTNEIDNLKSINASGMLMLVAPSVDCKTKINPLQLAVAIKNSTRTSDVIITSSANRFFILLSETKLKGAFCVWEKIKRAIGEQYTLNASMCSLKDKPFDNIKKELLNGLIEAQSTNQEVVILKETKNGKAEDWLDKINSTQKNFKLFKQAFNKKLEKVISPVFFQIQKAYEDKLFQTQIEQYSNSTISNFILKKDNNISELRITYPGFSKINIDIIHQGLDSPENKRLSIDLTELNDSNLTKVLEDFIAEFKANTNS